MRRGSRSSGRGARRGRVDAHAGERVIVGWSNGRSAGTGGRGSNSWCSAVCTVAASPNVCGRTVRRSAGRWGEPPTFTLHRTLVDCAACQADGHVLLIAVASGPGTRGLRSSALFLTALFRRGFIAIGPTSTCSCTRLRPLATTEAVLSLTEEIRRVALSRSCSCCLVHSLDSP